MNIQVMSDKDKYAYITKNCKDFFPDDEFEVSFIKLCLKIFFPECLDNNSSISIENAIDGLGSNDNGIDAYLVDEKSKIMHFFQFKTKNSYEKNTIRPNDAGYFFDLEEKLEEQEQHNNNRVQEIINDYKKNIKNHYKTEFHFFTSYNLLNKNSIDRNYDKHKFYFYGLDDVFNKMEEYESMNGEEPEKFDLKFYSQKDLNKEIPYWELKTNTGSKKTSIGLVTGLTLIELYLRHKQALFTRNVRYFIGNKGINKDIIKTAIEKPENFYFYNNGITITCDDYIKTGNSLELKKPQIINGAQTINSIYNAYEELKKDKNRDKNTLENHFNKLLVMTRIIQSTKKDNADFSVNVTKYNNTQNKVLLQDFYANDKIQKKIHELLLKEGYFYENKRGDFDQLSREEKNKYKNKLIEIGDLTMIYNTFKNNDSGTTSKKNKLFEKENFEKIFNDDSCNQENIRKMIISFNLYKILNDTKRNINNFKKGKTDIKNNSEYTLPLESILSEKFIDILKDGKTSGWSDEDCKKGMEQIEALKYPFSIISVVAYILNRIEKDGIDITKYYNDSMFYEKIQKKLFRKISVNIQKNFRKENKFGNIIHYFKTEQVEKDYEKEIIDQESEEGKTVADLFGLDFN